MIIRPRSFGRLAGMASVVCALATANACDRSGADYAAFRWTQPLNRGASVHVLDGSGSVTVKPAAGNAAIVTADRQWRRGRSSDVTFVINQIGNDYYVCAMWRGSGKCGPNGYRGARTSSWLTMFSLFHRSSDATATFTVEIPPGIPVFAQTTNGSVDVSGVNGSVHAKSVNGDVSASNASGTLVLSTVNGDVHARADTLAATDTVRLTTTNGSVFATLPSSTQGNFDLSVVNGSLHTDFALPGSRAAGNGDMPRRIRAQIGSLSRPVLARAINGSVTVTARGGAASH